MRKVREFSKEEKEFIEDLTLYTDIQRYEDNSDYYILAFGFAAFVLVYLVVSL